MYQIDVSGLLFIIIMIYFLGTHNLYCHGNSLPSEDAAIKQLLACLACLTGRLSDGPALQHRVISPVKHERSLQQVPLSFSLTSVK